MRFASRASSLYLRFSIFVVLLPFWYFYYPGTVLTNKIFGLKEISKEISCFNFPSTHNVVISIKTGATETPEKVPALMQTSLRCVENIYFFSDLEQEVGDYHMYDSLDTIPQYVTSKNTDFEFYHLQKALWQEKQDISSLRGAKTQNLLKIWQRRPWTSTKTPMPLRRHGRRSRIWTGIC
jgi:hypothetical protein